jgi:hypothetical protein
MMRTSFNRLREQIAASRARSFRAYLDGMSCHSLRGSSRFISLAWFKKVRT